MKLLVIGGGGREHALAWRLTQSPRVEMVYVAPGNGGTATGARMQNIALSEVDDLVAFAKEQNIAFAVVGPEAPLAAGVVDAFQAAELKIFGPTQAAAQLESSKEYAKDFMHRHQIPTAAYASFTDAEQAKAYIRERGAPIVVKADGLAAGKGVIVAMTEAEALSAVDDMLGGGMFGTAGARVVIEEFLVGEEASFIVMADGQQVLAMATSQDHKRLKDGDEGPNTGGMGAYSPAPIVSPILHDRIMKEVIHPTLAGMQAEGITYSGFLYAGLMIDEGADETRPIKVLEYNCRLGDPETQPIMMRVSNDLVDVFELAVNGKLGQAHIEWDPRTAIGVVVAAANYPEQPRTGDTIHNLPEDNPYCMVFHAGTKLEQNEIKTSGGRVLCVTAIADGVRAAQQAAYSTLETLQFDGMQYRTDIGWRALAAEK